jgi:cell division protease FtsH
VRDEEQHDLAFQAQRAAIELLTGRRDKLEEFARALLDREVLERPDIDEIMQGVERIERGPLPPGLRMVSARARGKDEE